jgi:hypothetical protein
MRRAENTVVERGHQVEVASERQRETSFPRLKSFVTDLLLFIARAFNTLFTIIEVPRVFG